MTKGWCAVFIWLQNRLPNHYAMLTFNLWVDIMDIWLLKIKFDNILKIFKRYNTRVYFFQRKGTCRYIHGYFLMIFIIPMYCLCYTWVQFNFVPMYWKLIHGYYTFFNEFWWIFLFYFKKIKETHFRQWCFGVFFKRRPP